MNMSVNLSDDEVSMIIVNMSNYMQSYHSYMYIPMDIPQLFPSHPITQQVTTE